MMFALGFALIGLVMLGFAALVEMSRWGEGRS
jgi:hypothetical protein